MNIKEKYPRLFQFLAGYFHEDWIHDYPDFNAAIDQFFEDEMLEVIEQTYLDLVKFLAQGLGEGDLGRALFKLGCYYLPEADGMTVSGWLGSVVLVLKERLSSAKHE